MSHALIAGSALASLLVTVPVFPSYVGAFDVIPGPLPGMEFIELPADSFVFGLLEDESGNVLTEGVPWRVRTFQVMTTEVTQGLWELVMGESVEHLLVSEGVEQIGPAYPMCCVSLEDCLAFVEALEAIDPEWDYRVPPTRYWEYACRAGTGTGYFWGDDTLMAISLHCWYEGNSGDSLHPVATRAPNDWGLYDTHGNVFEWTTIDDGIALEDSATGEMEVYQPVGGGSFCSSAADCRVTRYSYGDSTTRYSNCGLRVVRKPAGSGTAAVRESRQLGFWETVDLLRQEHSWVFFIEPMLSIGGIQHSFHEDDLEQFGYHVQGGCEQDAGYLRAGFGKQFGWFRAFAYGEVGHIGPGVLIDNHGPWILPEVLLRMNLLGGGIELQMFPLRARFGYGSYGGTAQVDEDTVGGGGFPTGSWTVDLVDARGFNYAVGFYYPGAGDLGGGVEWSQHFIDLRLRRSGTGVEPSDQRATQSEVRFFVNFHVRLEEMLR